MSWTVSHVSVILLHEFPCRSFWRSQQASLGLTLSVTKPTDPPVRATPENVLENMLATRCQHIMTVPILGGKQSFLEYMRKTCPDLLDAACTGLVA